MATFEIRHAEIQRRATAAATFHYFDVLSGETRSTVAVAIGDSVGDLWEKSCRNRQEVEWRMALDFLKRHVANVADPSFRGVFLTAQDRVRVDDGWIIERISERCAYEWKECLYQERDKAGLICGAAHPREPLRGQTTRAACEKCGLPSTDILCGNLVYPKTVGIRTEQGRLRGRSLVEAVCDVGSQEFLSKGANGGLCVPRGLGCWVQTFTPEREAERTGRDPANEALELADTLNIIFREQFGTELFRLKRFRTGRVILEPCNTEEAFVHKLEVLGDLIDLINSKELGEAQGLKSDGGSVNWLGVLLDKLAPGEGAPVIQTLRDIKTLRKHIAAHSAAVDHFVDASGRLGIGLPITDWNLAWGQVVGAFLHALRKLQALLP